MATSDSFLTERLSRWRDRTDIALTTLAIGSLPILLLETGRSDLPRGDRVLIDIVNVVVLICFAVDYVVELALAGNRYRYVRTEWVSLLIVVSQAIALLPALAAFGVLRALRAGKVVRFVVILLRAVAIGGNAKQSGLRLLREHTASFAFGLAGFTWIASAAAFTVVEDVGVGGRVESFFDALWWSLATITTVGYGDIYPITGAGRIVGGFTMIVGISTFALVTAKIAQVLVRFDD